MAFIKITTKEDLLKELNKFIGEEIVIHYNCRECDDEQVTHWTEVDEDMISSFEKDNQLFVTLECTNCDHTERFLEIDYIQGIETND